MVFLYNISESISSQRDSTVRDGSAGPLLESLRSRATAISFFWQHERFANALDLVRAGTKLPHVGLQILSGKFKKSQKSASHSRRLDKILIMCIIRV